jgi:S1-C subfamily serine protease
MRSRLVVAVVAALSLPACLAQRADESSLPDLSAHQCAGGTLDAKTLLACVSPSVALVETPAAGGSAILLEGGYLVTNAHVVDPYATASLSFDQGLHREDVPVVGIDALADIAVLGPIDVDRPALHLSSGLELAKGSDVFLVGFPGEYDVDPEPAISRGVLSRTRIAGDFEQHYLQTDASIGGGQSGGALVDAEGRIVGVSGLAFAEEFALALDGNDVQAAIDRIIDGSGDPYGSIPTGDGAVEHTIELLDEMDSHLLVVPSAPSDSTVQIELSVTDVIGLDVTTIDGEPLISNQIALEQAAAAEGIDVAALGIEPAEPVAPGVYEVDLPADIEGIIYLSTSTPGTTTVTVTTSVPVLDIETTPRTAMSRSDSIDGVVDYFEMGDIYMVDLEVGDEVELAAHSPQGDMAIYVRAPGMPLKDVDFFDDGGGGLYDYDASGTITADVAGTYVVLVTSFDGVVTGYRFDVDLRGDG